MFIYWLYICIFYNYVLLCIWTNVWNKELLLLLLNMDTQMYNTNYAMFAGPNIFALYITYLLILTRCF